MVLSVTSLLNLMSKFVAWLKTKMAGLEQVSYCLLKFNRIIFSKAIVQDTLLDFVFFSFYLIILLFALYS